MTPEKKIRPPRSDRTRTQTARHWSDWEARMIDRMVLNVSEAFETDDPEQIALAERRARLLALSQKTIKTHLEMNEKLEEREDAQRDADDAAMDDVAAAEADQAFMEEVDRLVDAFLDIDEPPEKKSPGADSASRPPQSPQRTGPGNAPHHEPGDRHAPGTDWLDQFPGKLGKSRPH